MTELFLRKATLAIAPNFSGNTPLVLAPEGSLFDGLRITFEVDKTSESNPNHGKISIYNLSESRRSLFETQPQNSLSCILSAGYSGLGGTDPIVSEIYSGDVLWAVTERHGPDLVTTLECMDAWAALRTVHVEQAFGPGTTAAQVINYLVQKLGLSVGTIVPAIKGVFQHGISISGLASNCLDHVTDYAGLEWHVTNGEINVLDPTQPLDDEAVLLTFKTGLIGYPSKREDFVFFKALLNPQLNPGRAVRLETNHFTGNVRCTRCSYRGDTHGGDFMVSVEARPLT